MPLWLKIVICVIGVEVLGASSGIVGAGSSREWYNALQDPPGTPPGWVFGPVGMLLSVPLSMTLKLALESDERTRWVAVFIGSQRDAQHSLAAEDEKESD